MVKKLNIIDDYFSHASSSSWYNDPINFTWERGFGDDEEYVVITDLSLVNGLSNKKVYGWLLESPIVTPHQYEFAKNNYQKFESIFTFDKEFLELSDKFVLIPLGGCWVPENDRIVHKKNKITSMVYSKKKYLEGHFLRHQAANTITGVDLYGSGYRPIKNKSEALNDYMFSITIENCKKDYYFSEKLIDCFITGTVPIYWGCPSIGDFFNEKGIITFDTIEELKQILNNLNEEDYKNMEQYVLENYEKAKKYLVADDIIYEKLKDGK